MKTSRAWTFRTDAGNTSTRGRAVVTPPTVSDDQKHNKPWSPVRCICGADYLVPSAWTAFTCGQCGLILFRQDVRSFWHYVLEGESGPVERVLYG